MRFLKRAKQPNKFTFTISIKEIMVEGSSRWQPRRLSVKLRRRKRHYSIEPKAWEPTLRNPYRGITFWSQAAYVQFDVTLYKNSIDAFEEKLWKLDVLDHENNGRIKRIATIKLDLSLHTTSNVTLERLPLKTLEPAIDSTICLSIDVQSGKKSSDTQILTNEAESPPQIFQAKQGDKTEGTHPIATAIETLSPVIVDIPSPHTEIPQVEAPQKETLDEITPQEELILEDSHKFEEVRPLNEGSREGAHYEETHQEEMPQDDIPQEEIPEEPRVKELREKARKLIAIARRGELAKPSRGSLSAHSTPKKVRNGFSSISSFETARQNSIELYDYPASNDEDTDDSAFRRNSIATRSARMRRFRFYQFRRVTDDTQATENSEQSILSPREDVIQGKISLVRKDSSCVEDELKSLEKEQRQIEEKTVLLKNQFMEISQRNGSFQESEQAKTNSLLANFNSTKLDVGINLESNATTDIDGSLDVDTEEQQKKLLKELCELVNKKNDVIRRQMQLNILEKEATLERTFEQLDKELRSIMLVEESKKTENHKQREKYLLDELVALVEKRNELVHDLDAQEKAIEEDNNLRENLRHVKLGDVADDQNCCIQ